MRPLRKILPFVILGLGIVEYRPLFAADCTQSPIIVHLKAQSDARSQRAAANLASLCTVKPAEIKANAAAKKCLGSSASIFSENDASILDKSVGKIQSTTLKALLPTIAALLDAAPPTAMAILITPTALGKDAIDTISRPDANSRDDLIKAAKSLVWDSSPQAFTSLSIERKAAVDACFAAR